MKNSIFLIAAGLASAGALAQEVGNVISTVPIVQQVQVPRQVCQQGMVQADPQQTTGAGGILGAIAGAAIGSQIGGGSGRGAAMVVGTMAGALVGNQVEANGRVQHAQASTHCTTQVSYENRTVAYEVTYEYAGKQHKVQLPYDPGPTIRLQVTPVGAEQPSYPPQGPQIGSRPGPVVVAPQIHSETMYVPGTAPVVVPYPAYPVVYPSYRPYYPPIGVNLHFGFGHRHGHGHGHRHWR
jgi:uncharacterized protein YcfJ